MASHAHSEKGLCVLQRDFFRTGLGPDVLKFDTKISFLLEKGRKDRRKDMPPHLPLYGRYVSRLIKVYKTVIKKCTVSSVVLKR